MNLTFRRSVIAAVLLGAATAHAVDPEHERLKLVAHFQHAFPDIPFDHYNQGALEFDPDAKSQYDNIMAYPPFAAELEQGERLWLTPFANGKTYAECLPNRGRMIAGNYPYFDETRRRVITFEDALNACREENGELPYRHGDRATMGLLTAYARTLSDGMKMHIRVDSPAAREAFEDGKRSFYARIGQLNFSCASCHVHQAGYRLGSELLSPVIGQATHWPVFRGGDVLYTLQMRYAACYHSMRHVGPPIGSERLNNLEYFHSYLSNGLEMKASVFRK